MLQIYVVYGADVTLCTAVFTPWRRMCAAVVSEPRR